MWRTLAITLALLILGPAYPAISLDLSNVLPDEGGSDTTTSPSGTRPVSSQEPLRIVTFGDSITEGYKATPYSVYLQQMLTASGCNATVNNQGKGGETTINGIERISSVLGRTMPHYIIIMEGANDVKIGLSAQAVVGNLGGMVDKALLAGSRPIVAAITPNTMNGAEVREIPEIYNPGIANMAAAKGVSFVDTYTALAGDAWDSYTFDGIHMTNQGAQVLAQQFMAAISCGKGGGGGGGGGGGSSGCFIATAAFGTPLDPYVVVLKEFRDRYLLSNDLGRVFVDRYYTYSPSIAAFISKHEAAKAVVRVLLLPLIGLAYLLINGYGLLVAAGLGSLLLVAPTYRRLRMVSRS